MKKRIILLPIVGLFLYLILCSYSYGPGIDCTGVTTSTGCGPSGCHTGAGVGVATTGIVITLTLMDGASPATSYIPSHPYTILVQATNSSSFTSLANFGFQ